MFKLQKHGFPNTRRKTGINDFINDYNLSHLGHLQSFNMSRLGHLQLFNMSHLGHL
jgi:hypothetical protein